MRFGNVLGSRGSFLHTLAHQVGRGVPVTVTHPDVERYFMSIPEAAGLVVEASAMANGGEVYVLDMGQPVRIMDLVRRFGRAAGTGMPEVRLVGLRDGEKLSEELTSSSESWMQTSKDRVWRVAGSGAALSAATMSDLFRAAESYDESQVMLELQRVNRAIQGLDQAVSHDATIVPAQRQEALVAAISCP